MTEQFKCAIVGVGGKRANGHAEAYQHIPRGRLAAISTRNPAALAAFGDQWGIDVRYTDYREMFAKEKPDLVHVNTPPDVRLEIFEAAEAAGIPALIVEKPLAIQSEDYLAMRDFARGARIKIAINHQLHFHPRRLALQQLVREGAIGDVRFIDASARLNLAYQGTHMLQAIAAFHPSGRPGSVMAQIAGSDGLAETPRKHFAPDLCMGAISFDDGVSALLRCGRNAPYVLAGDERLHVHKRVAVYGTRGLVQWTMWSWETNINGQLASGVHAYPDEDIRGQAAMTEAMFDWMEDDATVHPLNLDAALNDFKLILKLYASGLYHRLELMGSEPEPGLIDAMRHQLTEPNTNTSYSP